MTVHADGTLAVIGMSCRLPGADTPAKLWLNLVNGRETISFFDDTGARVETLATAKEGERIRAAGALDDVEHFDTELFGYSPLEATLLDPQQRIFLECAYTALDAAGCDPRRYHGEIGVYAGCSETPYLAFLRAHSEQLAGATDWQLRLATGIDFLTSRTAYKLGLRGPAVTVQTGCSTSLVAIHLACQGLLAGDCDVALAGGATVVVPTQFGTYTEEGVLSPDGHCRPFDARARGTVGADGVVIVVLKRLRDALADRDHIHALVLGSAINNDAGAKIGFTAPSVEGQLRVIRSAHAIAQVEPGSIGYVEAHGTATALGDAIEVAALKHAFAGVAREKLLLGSIKGNLGHTDAAAGATGLLKAVLALEHRRVPPTLHFTVPNPELALDESPFVVNATCLAWPDVSSARRASVSCFGIGGTNAHVVLEQAPEADIPMTAERGPQLLVLSAKTRTSLDRATNSLVAHLESAPDLALCDVAWTLQTGRQEHEYRRYGVCASATEATLALREAEPTSTTSNGQRRVVFMFPGHGAQSVGMARELYGTQRVFRDAVDRYCELATPFIGLDLRSVLYPRLHGPRLHGEESTDASGGRFESMELAPVAVFVIEMALTELWRDWGVEPSAVVGHSLGAYAAATVAGVLSPIDALTLVTKRSELLERLPPGAMLAVPLPEAQVLRESGTELSIAAVNSAAQCALSGSPEAIEACRRRFVARGIDARVLHIPRSGHSRAMDPVLDEFEACLRTVELRPPRLPWVSDMTGTWVSAAEAVDPRYFTMHLRRTVRFAAAVSTLFSGEPSAMLEVGPGRTLTSLARQHPDSGRHACIATLPHPNDPTSDRVTALNAMGRLWSVGASIAWLAVHDGELRRRVPVPTYEFDRKPCAITRWVRDPEPREMSSTLPSDLPDTIQPATTHAQQVAATFAAVLGMSDAAPSDNFFDLGGDSLMAAQLVQKLRSTFPGLTLTPRSVFKAPTVAALTRLVAEQYVAIERQESA